YRAGSSEPAGLPFSAVLETAVALGAPLIRIWAGTSSTAHTDDAQRRYVIDDCQRICRMTCDAGMRIACEFHDGTLTDSAEATHALLRAVDHPACATFWQPPHGLPSDDAAAGLRLLLPWLSHLHVFHWWPDAGHRLLLANGTKRWRQFFAVLADDPRDHWASLEFLPNDDPGLLPQEAQTLRQLLAEVATTQMQTRSSVVSHK
ncbi:MAG: TIM barrel protein, partial [bacterium]|nr:TIM barrel protein [bacterium]